MNRVRPRRVSAQEGTMFERQQLRTSFVSRFGATHALALLVGFTLAAPAFAQDLLDDEEPEENPFGIC